jgi:hypothetical protein
LTNLKSKFDEYLFSQLEDEIPEGVQLYASAAQTALNTNTSIENEIEIADQKEGIGSENFRNALLSQSMLKSRVSQLSGMVHPSSPPPALQTDFIPNKIGMHDKRATPRTPHILSKSFGSPSRITPSATSSRSHKPPVREVIVISSDEESVLEIASPKPIHPPKLPLEVSKTEPTLNIGAAKPLNRQVRVVAAELTSPQSPLAHSTSGPPDLPASMESSRPCGPFLYDFLPAPSDITGECTAVPRKDEWYAAHQEEEIFELANMLDEDKVIAALWSRWMLVHRYVYHLSSRLSLMIDNHQIKYHIPCKPVQRSPAIC